MRQRLIGSVLMAGAMLAPAGCDQRNRYQEPPPPLVRVAAPEVREIALSESFNGSTAAAETVDVIARVRGVLESVAFEPGSVVERDAVLMRIDAREYDARADRARADVDAQRAQAELADVTYQRAVEAAQRGAVTDLELREIRAQRDQARARLTAAEAEQAAAELELSWTTIRAPIAGRIDRNLVSAGNVVGLGNGEVLTRIVQDDPIHVYFTVDERTLLPYLDERPRPGDDASKLETRPIELTLADGTLYEHRGAIDYADSTVDRTTGTLLCRAVFPNPDARLYPGLFGRVRIIGETVTALLIPEIAIQRDLVGVFVYVVADDQSIERRSIVPGVANGAARVVTSGLTDADAVVVAGFQRVQPGRTVRVETDDAATAPTPADGAAAPSTD